MREAASLADLLFLVLAYDFTEQKVYEFVEKMQSLQIISLPNYTRKKSWLLTGLGFEKTGTGQSDTCFCPRRLLPCFNFQRPEEVLAFSITTRKLAGPWTICGGRR